MPLKKGVEGVPVDWDCIVERSIALTATKQVGFDGIPDINGQVDHVVGVDMRFHEDPTVLAEAMRKLRVYLGPARHPQIAADRLTKIGELDKANIDLKEKVLEIARTLLELDQKNKELGQTQEILQLFVGIAIIYIHDLKTPLTVLKGYQTLTTRFVGDLIQSQEQALLEEDIARVKNAVENVRQKLNSIRDFSETNLLMCDTMKTSLEQMSASLTITPDNLLHLKSVQLSGMEISQLFQKYLGLEPADSLHPFTLRGMIGKINVTAQIEFPESVPEILTNRDLLLACIVPLIHNSTKAMQGTPKVPHRIVVSAKPIGKFFQISIFNTGEGIPGEKLEELRRFIYSTEGIAAKLNPNEEGTGLSLKVIPRLIIAMGGEFEIDSAGGDEGATMTIRIPIAKETAPPGDPPAPN